MDLLIDTGASTSILPHSCINTGNPLPLLPASSHHMVSTRGACIKSYGSRRTIPLRLQGKRYTWDIEIADMKKAIFGADFLSTYRLTVDLQRLHLLGAATTSTSSCPAAFMSSPVTMASTTSAGSSRRSTETLPDMKSLPLCCQPRGPTTQSTLLPPPSSTASGVPQ